MVAISVLQPEPHDWSGAPVERPLPETRPHHRPPARSPSRPLPDQATRWRRRRLAALVVATLLAVAVYGVAQVAAPLLGSPSADRPSTAAGPGPAPVPGEVYVVQPGDTLWTIAAAVAPDRDPRPVVDRLRAVNDTSTLDVGDRLVIDLG